MYLILHHHYVDECKEHKIGKITAIFFDSAKLLFRNALVLNVISISPVTIYLCEGVCGDRENIGETDKTYENRNRKKILLKQHVFLHNK